MEKSEISSLYSLYAYKRHFIARECNITVDKGNIHELLCSHHPRCLQHEAVDFLSRMRWTHPREAKKASAGGDACLVFLAFLFLTSGAPPVP